MLITLTLYHIYRHFQTVNLMFFWHDMGGPRPFLSSPKIKKKIAR